ncbi:TBC1 domain family member 2B-like [Ruditapes philippinarum]|uniref:TBC1 domain family member 2B-like n=1 Tax=Ruditapes philippinarum TaxID=129788 RepID=UPI00295A7FF3|nr:TBC1 domain family member 2B-like [Ruditapes philippinarum]
MEEGGDNLEITDRIEQLELKDDVDITQQEENTVEIDSKTSDSTSCSNDNEENTKDNETKESKNPEERLCGWLHQRARGIGNLKTTRLRWFQFGDENCKLYIYREPQDLVPLGEINIGTASFYFDAGNRDKQGLFQIKSDGKEILLDAGNRHNMMYWLQALQNKRREFNLSRVNVSHDRVGQWSNKRVSNAGGLLSKTTGTSELGSQPSINASDLPEIRVPDSDTHSSNSSLNSLPPATSRPAMWALNNLKAEFQQKMSGIKFPAKPRKKKKIKKAETVGKFSRDGHQKEFSDSIFYCDLKVRSDSDILSTSTASINSVGSSEQVNCLLLDNDEKPRTGSQLSTESDEKDMEQTLTARTNRNVSRNTGSWTVIDKNDVISEEGVKGNSRTSNSDSNETWKPYTSNNRNQAQNDLDPGKSGKLFTTLKKMRFGRRQISEPGPAHRLLPQTRREVFKNFLPTSITSDRGRLRKIWERYKDICQGYELQHKFLTKEILELNDLRKDDLAKEKNLMMDFAKMQAKYYQIKSKYYVLLKQKKEQGPVREGEEGQEVVNQLLTDALETDDDDIELRLTGSGTVYDKYGFSKKHYTEQTDDDEEFDPLVSKAAVLEKQSEELHTKVKEADHDASLRVKWENYLVGRGGKLQKGNELKTLIRQGVPHEFREEVWKGCVNIHISDLREMKGANYYQDLQQQKASAKGSDPSIKQIELDLLRTLPNNKHYESIESEGILKLRRILLAFSEHNRLIGYCQGLNRLAAIALLFLNEEDAFWCLVAIVDYILPAEYFSSTLMAAQADQRVLKDLVQHKLPAVHSKLESNQVDLSLFTFNWFLTVFVDNVPTEMFLRIWDTFLYEGSKVLFRFAIAFLKKAEQEILEQEDGLQLNRYLRTIGEKMTNVKQISSFAFNWINPFPMRLLASRRQYHLQIIKGELAELDKLRRGVREERENSRTHDYYSDDELDN